MSKAGVKKTPIECPLSEKQVNIVSLLASGKVRKGMAVTLGKSEPWVCLEIRKLADRMHVPRQDAAIVAKALREGWIS